jgi:hypothetical protein
VLRQQLNVLRRSAPKRPALKLLDRLILRIALPARALCSRCDDTRATRHDCALASRRLSHLLALEVPIRSRPAQGASRSSAADPRDELNHADGIASIDLFVVPTISFRLLYGAARSRTYAPTNIVA